MERRLLDLPPTSSSTSKAIRNAPVNRTQSRWQKLQGWRVSVLLCTLTAFFTFLVNLALTIWASSKGLEGGIATIQSGDCNMTKRLDLWLHLGINLLSTMLLGASNYTMQCLSSPTRDEINKAHRQRVVVDIGIPSIRNLRRISWRKILLWWLVALSSIPLHLLYNSAVFSSISTPGYMVAVVSKDFLNGASFTSPNSLYYLDTYATDGQVQRLQKLRDSQSSLERLDNDECLKEYRKDFITNRRDVLVVSSLRMNDSLLRVTTSYPASDPSILAADGSISYSWTCHIQGFGMGAGTFPQNSCPFPGQNWTIDGIIIEYCLSEKYKERCTVQFSLVIMIIVIFCNLVKTFCMGLTAWNLSSVPILTLGDAVASFLAEGDPNTTNNCLADTFCFREGNHVGFETAGLSVDGPNDYAVKSYTIKYTLIKPRWKEEDG